MKTLFTSSFMATAFLLLSLVYCGLRKWYFLLVLNRDFLDPGITSVANVSDLYKKATLIAHSHYGNVVLYNTTKEPLAEYKADNYAAIISRVVFVCRVLKLHRS